MDELDLDELDVIKKALLVRIESAWSLLRDPQVHDNIKTLVTNERAIASSALQKVQAAINGKS